MSRVVLDPVRAADRPAQQRNMQTYSGFQDGAAGPRSDIATKVAMPAAGGRTRRYGNLKTALDPMPPVKFPLRCSHATTSRLYRFGNHGPFDGRAPANGGVSADITHANQAACGRASVARGQMGRQSRRGGTTNRLRLHLCF